MSRAAGEKARRRRGPVEERATIEQLPLPGGVEGCDDPAATDAVPPEGEVPAGESEPAAAPDRAPDPGWASVEWRDG